MLNFKGPIHEVKWVAEPAVEHLDEVAIRTLSLDEEKEYMRKFHVNIYYKANNFDSDLLNIYVYSEGLY